MEFSNPKQIREYGRIINQLTNLARIANEFFQESKDEEYVSVCNTLTCFSIKMSDVPAVHIFKNIEHIAEVTGIDIKTTEDNAYQWFLFKNTIFFQIKGED